jgi:hypothetical protein
MSIKLKCVPYAVIADNGFTSAAGAKQYREANHEPFENSLMYVHKVFFQGGLVIRRQATQIAFF